ncbi:uncharacterized protein L3040_006823 [Drepanopeziza brunnea f. sp. 'multigermtubi']|uniref:uncharacterized protein n=1 Tax=Drepanopeziza brunnea f. sp. 'multigermtubi' TaxID=698441 RepID=UPI0023A78776|nr:hypothetical protein L3040_006823 [Drepanopeziza brunnea f. sp. 'multigermtubi']
MDPLRSNPTNTEASSSRNPNPNPTPTPTPNQHLSHLPHEPQLSPSPSNTSPSEPSHEPQFAPGHPSNPRNWPSWRKWSIVFAITLVDLSVSWGASGYAPAEKQMQAEFGVSAEVGTLGLSLYILGLALGPMTLAPLSEYFGRSPIYILSYGVFLLFLLGTALVQDLGGFLVLRLLSGMFSSVTVANFGGTIADLWDSHDTGIPMSIYLWAATCGSPSGYFLFAFVAGTRGFRDVFWALLGVCGAFWVIMVLTLRETRHNIILARMGRTPPSQGSHGIPRVQRVKKAASQLAQTALKRPFIFLYTESIIQFSALYNGYLYGLSFLFNSAFVIVFGPSGHGFDTIHTGLCFLGISTGISIGPFTSYLFQEPYYQRKVKESGERNAPEARVMMGKIASVALPISLFWFAWTSDQSVHWIVPILASGLWGWSFYTLILMTYTYTEDSYKTFSASALAGIGLIRNIAGAGFPLFGRQMYHRLGNQGATSLLAGLACLMVPIPFILDRYGFRLRKQSPWASMHVESAEDERPGSDGRRRASDEERLRQ